MNISSGTIASTISNICINEATANNTHVINGGGITGGPVTVVDHQGVLEDYGQCVYDSTHVSPQAQEKPQNPIAEAIANIAGSQAQDSKPNGVGNAIAAGLGLINVQNLMNEQTSNSLQGIYHHPMTAEK